MVLSSVSFGGTGPPTDILVFKGLQPLNNPKSPCFLIRLRAVLPHRPLRSRIRELLIQSKALIEAVHTAAGIDQLLSAGKERVTF